MSDKKAAPCVVRSTPGKPLATEPHVADYGQDIAKSTFAAIDAAHPQDRASQGRCISAFDW